MYSLYEPWSKNNGIKLYHEAQQKSNFYDFDFRFSFPIHKHVKKFNMEAFYCSEHLEQNSGSFTKISYGQCADVTRYINSFLNTKKNQ